MSMHSLSQDVGLESNSYRVQHFSAFHLYQYMYCYVTKYKLLFHILYKGSCPDGSYPVNCVINPCQCATCPAVEGATCVADYCGGCNARWLLNGQEVTSKCEGEHDE